MSEAFVGEIRMFAGNFAPRGWAFCSGQLLAVSQNDALFSLFGTIYGGDGRTTFALPDLRGRLPIHQGQGPGLPNFPIGSRSGSETETINTNEMPAHSHTPRVTTDGGTNPSPMGRVPALAPVNAYNANAPGAALSSAAIGSTTGGGGAHNNLMPFLCVNFIVALAGIYPSRN